SLAGVFGEIALVFRRSFEGANAIERICICRELYAGRWLRVKHVSTTIDLECYAISDLFWKMIDDVFVDGIRRDQITVAVCYHYPKRRVQSQKLADVVAGADLGSRAMTVSPIPFAVHTISKKCISHFGLKP